MDNGFIIFKKDYILDAIQNFVNVFTGKYKSKLLVRSQIMSLWLMLKNIINPQCVHLWGKYYIWITQSEIANFIGWINGLREKNEKNVLASEFIIPSVSEHLIVLESLIQGEYSFDSDVEDIDKENECNEYAKTYKEKSLFVNALITYRNMKNLSKPI